MRKLVITALLLSAFPLVSMGQVTEGLWTYIIENGGVTITASTATGAVTIPSELGGSAVKKVGDGSAPIFGWPNTSVTSITISSIIIPNSVTSIGSFAFYGCTSLTSITIPNSVTSIGDGAFNACSSLNSITIPNSVTSIENSAFYNCTALASVTIGNSVTSIGDWVFYGCTSLTSVTIPNSVTSIGSSAFYGCSGLTSIIIPNSVTNIGDNAFFDCTNLQRVYLPARFEATYPNFSLTASQVSFYDQTSPSYLAGQQSVINNPSAHNLYTATQHTANFNAGKDSILNSPNSNGLYTTSQIQNMAVGDLVLNRQENGSFVLNYDIEKSEDLQTWTTHQALSLPLTGLPTDKAFVRIKPKQ